eukprot:SAG31_NODE_1052_length_10154_cov_2.814818_11_plen_127_part_00
MLLGHGSLDIVALDFLQDVCETLRYYFSLCPQPSETRKQGSDGQKRTCGRNDWRLRTEGRAQLSCCSHHVEAWGECACTCCLPPSRSPTLVRRRCGLLGLLAVGPVRREDATTVTGEHILIVSLSR